MQQGQHLGAKRLLTVLAFLFLAFKSNAANINYDPRLAEFSLRNYPALQQQADSLTGLGYQSLAAELADRGCRQELLANLLGTSPSATHFVKQLTIELADCRSPQKRPLSLERLLQSKQPYLITAGASLNAPMSYMGHTLLLFLDPNNFYFSPVISVLAPLDDSSRLTQTLQGGFGTISAEVTIIPLHKVLSSYANQDARELNFLQLPSGVFDHQKLIAFFSQRANTDLSYNFFTNNCSTYSYRALAESCQCLPHRTLVSPRTIQKEVYRALTSAGVDAKHFIEPALLSRFHLAYDALSSAQQHASKENLTSDVLAPLKPSPQTQATALAARTRFETYADAPTAYQRIIENNRYKSFLKNKTPQHRQVNNEDKHGIYESSLKAAFGERRQRLTYSLIDSDTFKYQGQEGPISKVTAATVSVSHHSGKIDLDSLGLIDISAIKPINLVSKKPSWHLSLGADRRLNNRLRPYLHYGIGAAVRTGGIALYTMPSIELSKDSELFLKSGAKLRFARLTFEFEARDTDVESLGVNWRASPNWGIEYRYQAKQRDSKNWLALVFNF